MNTCMDRTIGGNFRITQEHVHFLDICPHLPSGAGYPQASCVHIRQCTHACVTTITCVHAWMDAYVSAHTRTCMHVHVTHTHTKFYYIGIIHRS